MSNDRSSDNPDLDKPIGKLVANLTSPASAEQKLRARLDELDQQLAASEKQLQSLRLLAAKRQREIRTLEVRLNRYQERARRLRARLRDEQRANQTLSEEKEFAVRGARELRFWLNEIYASRIWKLASIYYRLVSQTPLVYLYDFLKMSRRYGLRYSLGITRDRLARPLARPLGDVSDGGPSKRSVAALMQHMNQQKYQAICIVASTFPFDETLNQRAIKLTTALAARNFGIVYVAWRWSRHERIIPIGEEVSTNIFQIPVDVFLEHCDSFRSLHHESKVFIAQFPYPRFLAAGIALKEYGFSTVYEVIDNWEEFHKVNQAPWYMRDSEEAMVTNFDIITAVSKPLRNKFSPLRNDIEIVPNGYDPQALGIQNRNVARPFSRESGLSVGYFGHLTDSWFDWDLLFEILDLAAKEHVLLKFHIIGYGEPRYIRNRLRARQARMVFHGRVPTNELYQHAANWDVGIIPFRKGMLGESVDPIKVYEYLYFGMPVMVSGISHLSDLPSVYCFDGAAGFMDTIRAICKPPDQRTILDVDNLLQHSTWDERFSRLVKLIQAKPPWKYL